MSKSALPSNEQKRTLIEEGEDTSHDAGDIISQESNRDSLRNPSSKNVSNVAFVHFKDATTQNKNTAAKEESVAKKEIGHPDRVLQKSESSESSDDDEEESDEETKNGDDNEDDRDENFIIESDFF